jgi:hypothetical protein
MTLIPWFVCENESSSLITWDTLSGSTCGFRLSLWFSNYLGMRKVRLETREWREQDSCNCNCRRLESSFNQDNDDEREWNHEMRDDAKLYEELWGQGWIVIEDSSRWRRDASVIRRTLDTQTIVHSKTKSMKKMMMQSKRTQWIQGFLQRKDGLEKENSAKSEGRAWTTCTRKKKQTTWRDGTIIIIVGQSRTWRVNDGINLNIEKRC